MARVSLSAKLRNFCLLIFFSFGGLAICAGVVQTWLIPPMILKFVESAIDLKVSGSIQPVFLKSEFLLDPVTIEWDQKIKVNSGRLRISYRVKLARNFQLSLKIEGKKVAAELLGDWASLAGGQSAIFDLLYADLVINRQGIHEVNALRADSPTIKFQFGESSNRRLRVKDET